jgi:hypothetical protein
MCRGRYKAIDCTHPNCFKHRTGECPFRHPDDDDEEIDRRIAEVRKRIFTEMDRRGYALHLDVLLEIGKINQETYDKKMRAKWVHEQILADNKGKGKGDKGARSRSPARSSSRTPTPNNRKGKGKGQLKGKDADPTPAETTADSIEGNDSRQRDHTSGQNDQSDTEPIAPPPADDTVTDGQANDNDNNDNGEHDDGLPDFGSPAPIAEDDRMETEEPTELVATEESATPAASAEYHMVTEANAMQTTTIDVE